MKENTLIIQVEEELDLENKVKNVAPEIKTKSQEIVTRLLDKNISLTEKIKDIDGFGLKTIESALHSNKSLEQILSTTMEMPGNDPLITALHKLDRKINEIFFTKKRNWLSWFEFIFMGTTTTAREQYKEKKAELEQLILDIKKESDQLITANHVLAIHKDTAIGQLDKLIEKIQLGKGILQLLEEHVQANAEGDFTKVVQQDVIPFLAENILDVHRVFSVCAQQIILCETIIRTNRIRISSARTVTNTTNNILNTYIGLEVITSRQKETNLSHQKLEESLLAVQENIKEIDAQHTETIHTMSERTRQSRE